jgi:hypothetical protein
LTTAELQGTVTQGMRYLVAAQQDRSSVIAHLHYSYAVNMLEMAHHGATRARIMATVGVDIDRVLATAKHGQDAVQRKLVTKVPLYEGAPGWGQVSPQPPSAPLAPLVAPSAPSAPLAPTVSSQPSAPAPPPPPGPVSAPTAPLPAAGPSGPGGGVKPLPGKTDPRPFLSPFARWWWGNKKLTPQPRGHGAMTFALALLMEGTRTEFGPLPWESRSGPRDSTQRVIDWTKPENQYGWYRKLAWLYEWPDDGIIEMVPNATLERIGAARAQLFPPGLTDVTISTLRIQEMTNNLAWAAAEKQKLLDIQKALMRYEVWLRRVLGRFQQYIIWFQHHLRKKEKKNNAVNTAITAVGVVINFIPVVGQILSALITVAQVALIAEQMKEQLRALAAAGGKIYAGEMSATMAEYMVALNEEIKNALDFLSAQEQMFVMTIANEQSLLESLNVPIPTPKPKPPTPPEPDSPIPVPVEEPGVNMLMLAGVAAAAVAAVVVMGGE